jgi:hypothetical protein
MGPYIENGGKNVAYEQRGGDATSTKCDRSISLGGNPYRDMAVRMCRKMGISPTDRSNTKHRWFSLQDVYLSPVFVYAIFTVI